MDVNCYSATSELFICKAECYGRLTKFKRAFDNLEVLKTELRRIYKEAPLRAKRLFVEDYEETSASRSKASKSLRFYAEATASCTSSNNMSFGQQPGVTPSLNSGRLALGLSPVQSHPYGLVVRAFPGQLATTPCNTPPLPNFTSTPKMSNISSTVNESETTKTVLTVHYPSKHVNKTLTGSYQAIGKALAHGVPSQIASSIMKCESVKNHIIEKTLKVVSKEVFELCSKKNPSLLRKSGKEDLEKFDLKLLCDEWKERAPLFYSFLLTSAINKRTKDHSWFASLAIAGSILLKQRSEKMDATASVLGVLLKSKSVEVKD